MTCMCIRENFRFYVVGQQGIAITFFLLLAYSALNIDNGEINKVKNQLTGEFGAVPDVARQYKVGSGGSGSVHCCRRLPKRMKHLSDASPHAVHCSHCKCNVPGLSWSMDPLISAGIGFILHGYSDCFHMTKHFFTLILLNLCEIMHQHSDI